MWFDTGYTDATVVMSQPTTENNGLLSMDPTGRAVEIGDEPAGSGYTGWSGSGKAPTWVTESVDLSEYAGQSILLRFQYTTDLYEARVGFALDDIELVELEETDGAEDESSPWIGSDSNAYQTPSPSHGSYNSSTDPTRNQSRSSTERAHSASSSTPFT